MEEVLSREPEPIQSFLLQTSILERLSGPLCEAVCSIPLEDADILHRDVTARADTAQPVRSRPADGGQAVLEKLERDNLFIIPLDDERRWYRYHRLFADLLRARLGQERAVPLHNRASEWYAKMGFTTDAIKHALAAGNSRRAADLVEGNALALLMRGELTRLLNWLVTLPGAEIRGRRWLCVYHAWALALSGDLGAVEPRLQNAERVMGEPSPEDPIVGHMAAIRAYISVAVSEPSRTIQLAHEALKLLPEGELVARSVVAFTLGGAYLLGGDVAEAARAFAEASAMGQAAGNLHLAAPATSHLADLQVQQGQLGQAAETYKEVLRLATTPAGQSLPVAAQGHSGLGELMYEWNDLPSAERHLAKSIELGKLWGNRHALIADYVALARVSLAQGEKKRAQDALREADALVPGRVNPLSAARVAALRAQLELAEGNLAAAERWTQECETRADDEPDYMREYEYLTLARLQIARHQPGEALPLLARLVQRAEATRRMGNLVKALALQALAFQALGDGDQATASLSQALSLAEPEGYVRVFADEGEPMAKLLGMLSSQMPDASDERPVASQEYVEKLLAALGEGVEEKERLPARHPPSLIEPLSEREMEVLRLVAAGLTNQEIGDKLVIALSTVKSHTNHIYGKLGVKNRTQAIAKAQTLGILQ